MLVLSRRLKEKIVFPNSNTTVQVVGIKSGVVRLGIEAPRDVAVLREEVQNRDREWSGAGAEKEKQVTKDDTSQSRDLLEQVRYHLKQISTGLGLARMQIDTGATHDATATLAELQHSLQILRIGIDGELEPATPDKPAVPERKTKKALLVEDDPNERELLAGFLRIAGLEVDTAGDGCAALDYLHSHAAPDVLLLDMGLPHCDGPTALAEIRREPAYAGLKIFAVTGSLPEEFNVATGPTGIDRWFHKPLDPGTLVHELAQELDAQFCGA